MAAGIVWWIFHHTTLPPWKVPSRFREQSCDLFWTLGVDATDFLFRKRYSSVAVIHLFITLPSTFEKRRHCVIYLIPRLKKVKLVATRGEHGSKPLTVSMISILQTCRRKRFFFYLKSISIWKYGVYYNTS